MVTGDENTCSTMLMLMLASASLPDSQHNKKQKEGEGEDKAGLEARKCKPLEPRPT